MGGCVLTHHQMFCSTIATIAFQTNNGRLDIAYNSLEGSIPGEIGTMGKLKRLDATGNRFVGSLP